METRLTNVEKSVGEIQGELDEICSMPWEILQNLNINSETNREHAELAPNKKIQIQERQDLGDDRAVNFNSSLNEAKNLARNPAKQKIVKYPYKKLKMKTVQ
ncbi:hypothetical protein Csa_007960 [Cucumis sativus]|uniref:Uncharacterized protein n=1 Tax=Cucumis sativus TaxID=3659 RepID=A0A0A0KQP4_CUCSA|nr:hypothetical protein Csa_007960 [Cucumis sativus]